MDILKKILVWSNEILVPWQRDAVRRLFEKGSLDGNDFDDLYAMMKSAHGIKDKKERMPIALSKDNLPTDNDEQEVIVLKSLHNLQHVNRIASKQKLEFSKAGMSIIYGGNGSGKSGYARVLKKACRARDNQEKLHTNAFNINDLAATPKATFDIEVSSDEMSVSWNRDEVAPVKLSTIAVFDSKCARAYLDNEQEAAYLPYGLDIVESLSQKVLPELSRRLSDEESRVNTNKEQFVDLGNETTVGQLIKNLSYQSDVEQFKKLAKLDVDEIKRLKELNKTLQESDPKEKARSIKLSSQRISELVRKIDISQAWVKDEAINKIKRIDNDAESAIEAEKLAAVNFRAGEALLDGTGDSLWKIFFESARKYSTEMAYPGKEYPNVEEGSKCLFCQRELDEESKVRLKRFEQYLLEDTARLAKDKKQERENASKKIRNQNLSFNMDEALKAELLETDQNVNEKIVKYETEIEQLRAWITNALETHDWSNRPILETDPRDNLKKIIENLTNQAEGFEKAADNEEKIKLEKEQSELRARVNLAPRLQSIIDVINGLKLKAKLGDCKKYLRTKSISDKAKELAGEAVTQSLGNALNREFQSLGIAHIKTKLKERIEKGKVLHKLILDLPISINLNEVLSEGEQRSIALGAFLAEIRLSNHKGGIVFDDPVSSLDHHHRQYVAQRLVDEAKERQVIIFTHDTVFLFELTSLLNQKNVPYLEQHLECFNASGTVQVGLVREGLPWVHKSFNDRIDKHYKTQRNLLRGWVPYSNDDLSNSMRSEYSRLRATIERVIQDCVFNGTVQRYNDWIKIHHLKKAIGFTLAEHDEIVRLYQKCCDICDAHDPSSGRNLSVPSPQDLKKDLDALVVVVDTIKGRQNSI